MRILILHKAEKSMLKSDPSQKNENKLLIILHPHMKTMLTLGQCILSSLNVVNNSDLGEDSIRCLIHGRGAEKCW